MLAGVVGISDDRDMEHLQLRRTATLNAWRMSFNRPGSHTQERKHGVLKVTFKTLDIQPIGGFSTTMAAGHADISRHGQCFSQRFSILSQHV
jgi:hypothetical protein